MDVLHSTDSRCCYCGAVESLNRGGKCSTGFPHCFLLDMRAFMADVEARDETTSIAERTGA